MADNNGVDEQNQDDALDDEQVDAQQDEMSDDDDNQAAEGADEAGDADDEVVITIGEESPPHDEGEVEGQPAPKWVKDLRKRERELARENRELKAAQAAASQPQQAQALGAKPTLESVDYDTDRFETELTDWHERKRKADDAAAKKQKEVDEQQAEFNGKLSAYKAASRELKVSDFEEAEAVVAESFSQVQQNIMLDAVSSPLAQAQMVSALGRNEARLKQLASIKNPIKFAVALSELEKQLKVTNRKAPPAPERTVRGSASAVGVNDPKLARLEAAAEKSGDRSALISYKKSLKEKANA